MKLWGGRFEGETDPDFFHFSESFSLDHRLILYQIRVDQAYLKELQACGLVESSEEEQLQGELENLRRAVLADPDWARRESAEDVHTWVEGRLLEAAGPPAKKMRTGRSRNDLVATLLRMWVKDATAKLQSHLLDLTEALLQSAERHPGAVLPGYTHLQRAQVILWPHFLLAYGEMLRRDWSRLRDCAHRADELPLGCGALAGSSIPVDRERMAHALGFRRVSHNSLDATSDRDFVAELIFACALLMTHLSRLAEDLILYSSSEFGFLELDDAFATGSSLMPQKKNPDSLELVRGRAGRVQGRLAGMLSTLKGLPMAYNRDLQEDKVALFDAVDTTAACIRVMAGVARTLRIRQAAMRQAAAEGFLMATELAEQLVDRGVRFGEAHAIVGRLVRYCLAKGKRFGDLSSEEGQQFTPHWDSDLQAAAVSVEDALEKKRLPGGTAPSRVAARIHQARQELSELRKTS